MKKTNPNIATALKRSTWISRLWERLEVEQGAIMDHPKITHILVKSLGSIDEVIEYLRGSEDKAAVELVRIWDTFNESEHNILPFEAFCLAAKSTPKRMMGVIMEAVTEQSHMATELLVASSHTEIVRTTVDQAKLPAGISDRETMHKNRGFLPIPKTQNFNNFGGHQDNRKQIANVSINELDSDNDKISAAVDQFNAQRTLGTGEPKVVVAELVDEE